MSDFMNTPDQKTLRVPLDLVECKDCTLLQLRHTAPQDEMYRKYWYKSGINEVIIFDLKQIVDQAMAEVRHKEGDIFLDIGANDGTLLRFVPSTFTRVGCEPARTFQDELRSNCDEMIPTYWDKGIWSDRPKAKIITAIGMFYDSEDPNAFVAEMKDALAKDGVIIAQMMTLKPMIANADLGNICHEHLEFYNYASLVQLFEQNGLEIYKVEENAINGGSYRLFIRHYKGGSISYPEAKPDYADFVKRIKENRERTLAYLKEQKAQGKKIYAYGASTKGNTIAQYYGLTQELIDGVADRNPQKWGKYMVGSGIHIVSEDQAREEADIFLVFPYAFLDQFLTREQEWRSKGGVFVVSTPTFKTL